jgi:DNA-binding NtrC family response regulator
MNADPNARQLLIVDDELAMRQALKTSFVRSRWTVETATGVADALGKIRTAGFPVVLTDMRMLDGTGLELVKQMRATAPRTAMIVLTAYGSVPDAVEAMRCGACEYLVKPVSFERLEAAAEGALERFRQAALKQIDLPAGREPARSSQLQPVAELLREILSASPAETTSAGTGLYPGLPLREAERRLLETTLEATGGNRTRAAEMLGISLRTIRNKIRAYGLPPRRFA